MLILYRSPFSENDELSGESVSFVLFFFILCFLCALFMVFWYVLGFETLIHYLKIIGISILGLVILCICIRTISFIIKRKNRLEYEKDLDIKYNEFLKMKEITKLALKSYNEKGQ